MRRVLKISRHLHLQLEKIVLTWKSWIPRLRADSETLLQVTSKGRIAQEHRRLLTRRQSAWMVCKTFRVGGENEAMLDFGELKKLKS